MKLNQNIDDADSIYKFLPVFYEYYVNLVGIMSFSDSLNEILMKDATKTSIRVFDNQLSDPIEPTVIEKGSTKLTKSWKVVKKKKKMNNDRSNKYYGYDADGNISDTEKSRIDQWIAQSIKTFEEKKQTLEDELSNIQKKNSQKKSVRKKSAQENRVIEINSKLLDYAYRIEDLQGFYNTEYTSEDFNLISDLLEGSIKLGSKSTPYSEEEEDTINKLMENNKDVFARLKEINVKILYHFVEYESKINQFNTYYSDEITNIHTNLKEEIAESKKVIMDTYRPSQEIVEKSQTLIDPYDEFKHNMDIFIQNYNTIKTKSSMQLIHPKFENRDLEFFKFSIQEWESNNEIFSLNQEIIEIWQTYLEDIKERTEEVKKLYEIEPKLLDTLNKFNPEYQVFLPRLAELLELDNDRAEGALKFTLEGYPELGAYDDMAQVFKPADKLNLYIDDLMKQFADMDNIRAGKKAQ